MPDTILTPEQYKLLDAWITELESGNYDQAANYLCTEKGYCCLGVAVDVLIAQHAVPFRWAPRINEVVSISESRPYWWQSEHGGGVFSLFHQDGTEVDISSLPQMLGGELERKLGISHALATFLATKNDNEESFYDIAKFLRYIFTTDPQLFNTNIPGELHDVWQRVVKDAKAMEAQHG